MDLFFLSRRPFYRTHSLGGQGTLSARLSSAALLTASGQDGLAQATSGFFVEGGNDFGQRLSVCSVGSAA